MNIRLCALSRRRVSGVEADDVVLENIRNSAASGVDFDMYVQSSESLLLDQETLLLAIEVSSYKQLLIGATTLKHGCKVHNREVKLCKFYRSEGPHQHTTKFTVQILSWIIGIDSCHTQVECLTKVASCGSVQGWNYHKFYLIMVRIDVKIFI